MYAEDTSFPKVDQSLATAHLKALGYQQGDAVYMRYINPVTKKSIKASKLNFTEANRYQNQGYDAYFAINGGDTDRAVTECRAIFYEHDNLDKSVQLGLWQSLKLPEPTIQVDTGGKSIHSYWVLNNPISPEQWKELQTDLLGFSNGDRTLKNPSRIMRLAGSYYMKGDNPGTTAATIVSHSRQHYSYEELRAVIPQAQQPGQPTLLQQPAIPHENITLPVPESVPLELCLSKGSRSLLQSGTSNGGRNVNGAKLARDLIGTANYLQSIGQRFDSDPWQLFLDYCHRCPSGSDWNEGEWKSIWKFAVGAHPTPSCKEEGVETCVRAWYWNNYVKPNTSGYDRGLDPNPLREGKRSASGGATPPTVKTLSVRERVLEILSRNLSASERKAAFFDLAGSTGRQVREVEKLAELIESEVDLIEGRVDRADELNQLLKISDRRLTLSRYLHPNLAQPLEKLAGWMGVDAEALLTVLISTAASLLHPEARVIVKECIDFVEPMVFYTGIVTESGNRKSPILKAITKPLRKLQDEEDARYKSAYEEYKADLHNWKKDKSPNKGPEPEPPAPPREYYVDNFTSEALDRVKANQPEHGLLIQKDELSSLFASYGAYKNGRGSDKEGVLSGWNGNGVKKNRVTSDRVSLSHDASSIAGAIQPGKLRKIMGDMEDEQGEWARFLWYLAPLKACQLPDEDTRFEVGDLLEGIYRKLDKLEPVQYRFTSDAQSFYQDWHWELEQRKLAEPKQGMRAAIAKLEGYTARLAGILHILWSTASDETPGTYIPIERVKAAKALAEFYLGQVRLMHSDGEADQGERTPILNSILKKLGQMGQLAIRNAQSSIKALRKTKAPQVLEYFKELEAMGHARVEGKILVPLSADPSADPSAEHSAEARTVDNVVLQPLANKFADPSADRLKKARTVDNRVSQPLDDKNADRADHNLISEPAIADPWSESEPDELLQKGDRVQYSGEKFQRQYQNLLLTIHEMDIGWDQASCLTPDGGITTWLPLQDLRRVSTG